MGCQDCKKKKPCKKKECACPVKDLYAKCVIYDGEELTNTGIATPDTLDVIIYKLDKAIKDFVENYTTNLDLKNIGVGAGIYAGKDNTGKRKLRSIENEDGSIEIEELADTIKISASYEGTISSVGLNMPDDVFSVTGSPVTDEGDINVGLKNQTKNTVFSAPVSQNGKPTFRPLEESDIPTLHKSKITDLDLNNKILTIDTDGIATGGGTWEGNSSSNKTITIKVLGTNLSASVQGNNLIITSSTGEDATVDLSSIVGSGQVHTLQEVTTKGKTTDKGITINNGNDSIDLKNNGDIEMSGHITALGGGGIGSDKRLKEVQKKDLPKVIDKLKPVVFKWIKREDSKDHIGYIAQEIQKILPDSVRKTSEGYLTVNYTEVHTAAINNLYQKVKEQEQRISELETKLKTITKQ